MAIPPCLFATRADKRIGPFLLSSIEFESSTRLRRDRLRLLPPTSYFFLGRPSLRHHNRSGTFSRIVKQEGYGILKEFKEFAVFLMIRNLNKMKREEEAAPAVAPITKDCPYRFSTVAIKATRCGFCTSELKAE